MIDKRKKQNQHDEIDNRLVNLTDTEIMLEFSKLLTSIYPHLVKIYAHHYDPYDKISEDLFYSFVYSTFSAKYGAIINRNEIHKYAFNLHCYHKIHRIQIKPKSFPLALVSAPGHVATLTEDFLKGKDLIFIQFGDTENNLTGDAPNNLAAVNFNFTQFTIVDSKTGLNFRNYHPCWVNNKLVDFDLVLEDYDKNEHQFYKQDQFAD